ncbi:MAG: 50S ribosomal protein L13 [Patescibacteria group bacterium]
MEKIDRKTHSIDATDLVLGRLATKIAIILRGKNKATFRPNVDGGDIVEVTNCSKIKFTGKKLEQKEYIWHTTHPGGLKRKKVKDVFSTKPGEVLRVAVMGMLPKNKLRDQMIKRLKIIS